MTDQRGDVVSHHLVAQWSIHVARTALANHGLHSLIHAGGEMQVRGLDAPLIAGYFDDGKGNE